jgi:hypothetical protein
MSLHLVQFTVFGRKGIATYFQLGVLGLVCVAAYLTEFDLAIDGICLNKNINIVVSWEFSSNTVFSVSF